jgi:hypothetical protein
VLRNSVKSIEKGGIMTTVMSDAGETVCAAAESPNELWLSQAETLQATGWQIKPEGLCKGETCVPIPAGREAEFLRGDEVNVAGFWEYLGNPVATTDTGDAWFLGEGAEQRNEALMSLEAPNFTLPDFSGKLHSLTDFRRKRVLLITWASW